MQTIETRSFELTYADEPSRIIRGRIAGRSGAFDEDMLKPHVLVLHGFKGFMNWGFFPTLCERLALRGFMAVSFNVSGSGVGPDLETMDDEEGFARNTVGRELEDIDRVRAYVRSGDVPGIDASRAGLLGHSRGGGNALIHAARHGDYGALVTWAAIDSHDRFTPQEKDVWRERGFILIHNGRTGQDLRLDVGALEDYEAHRAEQEVLRACRRIDCPTLVVHGSADEAVEPAAAQRIVAALPAGRGRLLEVAGTGHTFGGRHPLTDIARSLELVLESSIDHLHTHLIG